MAMSPGPERIVIEVDELVLDSRFTAAQRERVAESFGRELGRLLTARGLPHDARDRPEQPAQLPRLALTASPRRFGEALAHAVHSGLTDPRRASSGPARVADGWTNRRAEATPAPAAERGSDE
jgi:hypothetical protein